MREKKLEVLAPAGSFESLRAAVNAGADAVYMGGSRFGARAYAQNPEGENLLGLPLITHICHGVRLYLIGKYTAENKRTGAGTLRLSASLL